MNSIIKALGTAFFKSRGYYPARVRGRNFRFDPYNISFWRTAEKDAWEPRTYDVMDKYLEADMVYMDIGAWIGPTVTYAAGKVKEVICFEPDIVAYRYLLWNIDLNSLRNVLPFNVALSDKSGIMRMSSFGKGLGDSMTSLLNPDTGGNHIDVPVLGWDNLSAMINLGDVGFIKMDIEGGEFRLLPTMADYLRRVRPAMYLSLHGKYLPAGERKEAMDKVIEVMAIYGKCLDENMNVVAVERLSDSAVADSARTFLFLNE